MIVAGTGHRPDKLGGYRQSVLDRLIDLALDSLRSIKPKLVITGMALGWDTALALASIELGVPFHAYVPFKGQELAWPKDSQIKYRDLLKSSDKVVVCSPGDYSNEKMQIRNEQMVNDSDLLMALWNGSPGGTRNCLEYAGSVKRKIVNVWPYWIKHYRKCPNQHI